MLISVSRALSAATLILGLVAVSATPSFAQNRSNTNANGINSTDRDTGRDRAQDRQNPNTANSNSNGINAIDRDKGLDRAQDRMNQQGLDNNKASAAPSGKGAGRK
jgi:hypothetical protein